MIVVFLLIEHGAEFVRDMGSHPLFEEGML
jgi:hypothetical protein